MQFLWLTTLIVVTAYVVHGDMGVDPNASRLCYSCAGINCQRTTKQNVTMQCSNVLDYCVTVFDEFAVLAKGCYSEMPSAVRRPCDTLALDMSATPSCQKCNGQLCNNKGRQDVQCITCSASDTSKCTSNADAITPQQCDAPTALNAYCYVRETAKEGVTRGCALHQSDQNACLADASCSLCLPTDTSACNSYALRAESAAVTHVVQQHTIIAMASVAAFALRLRRLM